MAQTSVRKRLKKIIRSPRLLLITATLVVLSTTLLFANKGVWRHVKLRSQISSRQDDLSKLLAEESDIRRHVNLLRSEDPNTIERVARERYNMKKSGEIIYRDDKN
jgi:cell division protein FtsB